MKYYTMAIKNYAVFSGRATRKEFWMFMLFNILIALALVFATAFIMFELGYSDAKVDFATDVSNTVYNLFILLPFISITVRRLHDSGLSGWWYFLGLIPMAGWIAIIALACRSSEPFPNEYGPHIAPPEVIDIEFEELIDLTEVAE